MLVVALAATLVPQLLHAQGSLLVPRESQRAEVMQRIGLTDIRITYSVPTVKGRVVWGELVPFGEVWRAGANENTVISFSTDVTIDGKPLRAGSYGLHMIPRKDQWTVIFSSNSTSWGSYFYSQAEDVLRVDIIPEALEHQEWLSYSFTDPKASSVRVLLRWEKIGAGFMVGVNVKETVLASMRQELRGPKFYSWENTWQAADYCLQNNLAPEDATRWIDQSLGIRQTFLNLNTKAGLLEQRGDKAGAATYREKALKAADETQLNAYGYKLLGEGKLDEAEKIFRMNIQRYPESWNVYDSLGELLEIRNQPSEALVQYKKALQKAPDAQRKRISDTISRIEKNMKTAK